MRPILHLSSGNGKNDKQPMKAKRAVVWSTALVAKEEKEAPYCLKDTIIQALLLDDYTTNTLRKGYAPG
jgi:hypothetical protein